jgi:RNA polymerase sigma factor (TIGR02999 family)
MDDQPVDGDGSRAPLDELIPAEYEELRLIARRQLAMRDGEGTLSPTGLVHEAYLRLARGSHASWRDRGHFTALVAIAMRHVLVDRARARHRQRRNEGLALVTLDDQGVPIADSSDTVLQLNDAIEWLASVEPRLARVIDCRFFMGLNDAETAEALGITARTVQRDWAKAKMLLRRALSE